MGNKNSISPAAIYHCDTHVAEVSLRTDVKPAWNDSLQDGAIHSNNDDAFEALELLKWINSLPSEEKSMKKISSISEDIDQEERKIIKKLRDMADYLAKTHSDVLIADRVGTGVGIGAGVMTIGGLIAAPFTAGFSLGLTMTGIAGGVLGSFTSVGANVTGYFILKQSMKKLAEDVGAFNLKLEELSKLAEGSKYLKHAARFRPSLERLCMLSKSGFIEMLTTIQTVVQHALREEYAQINCVFDRTIDPEVKRIVKKLNLPSLDPGLLNAFAEVASQILGHVRSAWNAMKAFVNYLAKPELARVAMFLTSLNSGARAAGAVAQDVAEVSTAFKGTPLAMSKAARGTAAAFTAAFIVVDILHMIRICQETGETPTVQQLRSLADEMETDLMGKSEGPSPSAPLLTLTI